MQEQSTSDPLIPLVVFVRVVAGALTLAAFGVQPVLADGLPPHPPADVRAAYDEDDGTVGIDWERSFGALRYEIGEGDAVVYSGGWDTGATLVTSEGAHNYRVRACNDQCGDWTDPVSVTVGANAPPSSIRYGGGFTNIVFTPNADSDPLLALQYGEIHLVRGAYRATEEDERALGGSVEPLLYTAYESEGPTDATPLAGRFFLISGLESAVDRFSLSFDDDDSNRAVLEAGIFLASWDSESGWRARNNLGTAESFTPLSSDAVIAIGYRAPSSLGIDSLKSLVPDDPVPPGIRYGGGVMDLVFRPNASVSGNNPLGDIRVSDGVLRLPDGEERYIHGDELTTLFTPFEPGPSTRGDDSIGRFFVVSSAESAQDRFSLAFRTEADNQAVLRAGFFIADWTEDTGWQARNNPGHAEAFDPLETDVVVAVGHRASTASPGLDGLRPLTPKAALSKRGQALTIDLDAGRLYRLEYGRSLVTDVVDLGSTAPLIAPRGMARVSDGVALIVDRHDDRLYRLEYTDTAVGLLTALGDLSAIYGSTVAPESLAHVAPGIALIGDDRGNRLLRVEYNDTEVTGVAELGDLTSTPWGMASIDQGAALVADAGDEHLYRVDYSNDAVTVTSIGDLDDIDTPTALAHVAPGVALVTEDDDPDTLFRVEYTESGVSRTVRLGEVRPLHGLYGLTLLPPSRAADANTAPLARDDTAETTEGVPVAIDVLANDTDADRDALTVDAVTQPFNGATVIQNDGSVAYSPAAHFTGEDNFSYTVFDGTETSTATVTVTVEERPLAVYDPDVNTISVFGPGPPNDFDVEVTFNGVVVAIHRVQALQYTNSTPQTGLYSYRIRSCLKSDCGDWSSPYELPVSVPGMFTDEPRIETATAPGSLPYDVGVTKGGQAYVNVPVQPVPGVNGLAPRLSIDYSGGRERQLISDQLPGDILGYGWRVSGLSTIRRCTKNRPEADTIGFGNSDGLCLDGEPLVRVNAGQTDDDDPMENGGDDAQTDAGDNVFAAGTEYRSYRENYAKILVRIDSETQEPWFEVFHPDGRVMEFGRTEDSRLRLADGGVIRTEPFLWSVNRERDAYGNAMVYRYHEDEASGVRHPLRIAYGSGGDAEIRFRYAARQDEVSTPYGAQTRTESLLLHTIQVRLNGSPVRDYRLVSETTDEGWRRLGRLQLCGYDERGSTADCLAPMDFDWMTPDPDVEGFTTCVERFTDPLGRATAFEHKIITEEGVQFAERPFGDAVNPGGAAEDALAKPVVAAMERGNGIGGMHRTEYAYHGKGFLSTLNWGFLGFYATRMTDTSTGVVTYLQYRLDRPHYARVSAVHQYDRPYDPDDSDLETLSRRLTFHNAKQIGSSLEGARYVPFVRRQTELFYEGGERLGAKQTRHTMTFDENGLLTRTARETFFGTGALGASPQPGGVWGSVPAFEFDAGAKHRIVSTHDLLNRTDSTGDVAQWLLGFTCRAVLEEKRPGTPLRRRWGAYSPDSGSVEIDTGVRFGGVANVDCPMDPGYAADASLKLTQAYVYDSNGNLTSTALESTTGHVPRRETTASSFVDDRYPQHLTNAAGHVETRSYDARFGLPKSSTGPNGQTVTREYDPFGREVRYTTRDGVSIGTRYLWCGTDLSCDRAGNVDPVMAVETDSSISPRTVTYLDRLGRRVRTETQSFDGASVDREDIHYDDRGRVSRVSAPYRYPGPSGASDVFETEYDYDIRDRVTKLNRADGGEVAISREACRSELEETAKETVYAADGAAVATRSRVSRYNLAGELVQVTEGGGAATGGCGTSAGLTDEVMTAYAYNSSGQVRAVTVAGEEVVSYGYDAAGYRLVAENADFGRVEFTHTALGELRTREHAQSADASLPDPEARPVTYTYDALGRLVEAQDSAGSSHWAYDGATNGIGLLSRRCRMPGAAAAGCGFSATFDASYAYNADARLSSMIAAIASGGITRTYAQSYGYDGNGRLETMLYPSGLTARYQYNATGRLHRILDDGDSSELAAYTDRDPWGGVTAERLGNGALVSRTFDPASGRQTRQDVRLKGKLRHDARYDWRTDGLLEERSIRGVLDDGTSSGYREESFRHDGLGRMTRAAATSGSATRTLTTSYDALGNVLAKTSSVAADLDVTDYDYDDALNAVQSARVGGVRHQYTYDRTGRMTRDRRCQALTGECISAQTDGSAIDRHIEWDRRGLATGIVLGNALSDAAPAVRETFRYGPDEARYERLSEWREDDATESVRTFYVGGYEQTFMESDSDVVSVERTRLPGGVVHVKTTPAEGAATETFEYRHVDHLGSAALISDAAKAPLSVLGHDPFGGRRRADWTRELTDGESAELSGRRTVRGFTGHEHLDRTGLVHMNGRLYDPQLGRFASPDPYVTDPAMGQDWNRYSYVSNSPMSYADPTGYVRAGPGCDSITVFCAAQEQGGGFTRTAQGFEHRGRIAITIPYVTVSWGLVYGGWGYGSDYGFPLLAPRYTVRTATFQVPFVVPGFLQVDGESPADEPIPVVVVTPSRERPGDYDALFDELHQLWNQGAILVTRREDSILYQRRRATVLVKNNEPEKGIPQVHGRAVVDGLEVSAQEGQRAQIISGYRRDSMNHMKYGAIDVYIEGYSTEQTAEALCRSGRFNRVSSYPGRLPGSRRLNTAHADYREDRSQGLHRDWVPLGRRCR